MAASQDPMPGHSRPSYNTSRACMNACRPPARCLRVLPSQPLRPVLSAPTLRQSLSLDGPAGVALSSIGGDSEGCADALPDTGKWLPLVLGASSDPEKMVWPPGGKPMYCRGAPGCCTCVMSIMPLMPMPPAEDPSRGPMSCEADRGGRCTAPEKMPPDAGAMPGGRGWAAGGMEVDSTRMGMFGWGGIIRFGGLGPAPMMCTPGGGGGSDASMAACCCCMAARICCLMFSWCCCWACKWPEDTHCPPGPCIPPSDPKLPYTPPPAAPPPDEVVWPPLDAPPVVSWVVLSRPPLPPFLAPESRAGSPGTLPTTACSSVLLSRAPRAGAREVLAVALRVPPCSLGVLPCTAFGCVVFRCNRLSLYRWILAMRSCSAAPPDPPASACVVCGAFGRVHGVDWAVMELMSCSSIAFRPAPPSPAKPLPRHNTPTPNVVAPACPILWHPCLSTTSQLPAALASVAAAALC